VDEVHVTQNQLVVLFSLHLMHKVSGYNPTIGEVARVAGVSYGVAYRALEKLCGLGFIRSHVQAKKKVGYRFSDTWQGEAYLKSRGRV
jgi:hypothetical protein